MMQEHEKLKITATIFGILASIFIITGVIVNIYHYIPIWLIYVTVIFMAGMVLYVFSCPFYNFFGRKILTRKHNAMARYFFVDFEKFVEQLDVWLEPRRSNNIPSAINRLADLPDFKDRILQLPVFPLHDLFYFFKERIKRFDGSKEDFSLLIHEFEKILRIYYETCIKEPVEIVRRIGGEKMPKHVREEYKKYKGDYDHFVRDYIGFGKTVNDQFGENICNVYIEMPWEL
ncbi:MAG: hypothetical protein L6408_00630 [Nanoarchaeota archaeon]|nr:hypothetical protein [Nanoarchaeota archaeon]